MKNHLWLALVIVATLVGCSGERTRWDFQTADDLKDWEVNKTTEWDEPIFSTFEVQPAGTGQLHVVADHGTWYQSMTGGLMYRLREGDTVATARLNVYGAEGPLPKGIFELAGLMVRRPIEDVRHEPANWEYLVTGGSAGARMIDAKTTRNSVSVYQTVSAVGPWIEVRLIHWGHDIAKLWREDGGEWKFVEAQARPDLEGKLQWGISFLSNWGAGPSDLRADIDWISLERFDPHGVPKPTTEEGWKSFAQGLSATK